MGEDIALPDNDRCSTPWFTTGNIVMDDMLDARRASRAIYKSASGYGGSNTSLLTLPMIGSRIGRRRSSALMHCVTLDIDAMSDISEMDFVF